MNIIIIQQRFHKEASKTESVWAFKQGNKQDAERLLPHLGRGSGAQPLTLEHDILALDVGGPMLVSLYTPHGQLTMVGLYRSALI